jgi:NitT/TauT family transport system substrate-binding protein
MQVWHIFLQFVNAHHFQTRHGLCTYCPYTAYSKVIISTAKNITPMNPQIKIGIAIAIIGIIAVSSYLFIGDSSKPQTKISETEHRTVRVGYFPNITHAQAVIGFGTGEFQKALGAVTVETKIFNAGPSAIEALFADQIDVSYIGPNPAINGYVRSHGEALRVVAGAASGGAVFVVRNDASINSAIDFSGKTFATPQLGNTQDVALRAYLLQNGYETTENGGTVKVTPAKNPDAFTLMVKKEIDGAWVPEPWGAKMIKEANAKILVDERDLWSNGQFITALVIVRTQFLEENPDIIKTILEEHVKKTEWIKDNPEDAAIILNEQIEKLSGQKIDDEELRDGLSRLDFTYDPIKSSLLKSAQDAYSLGFLDESPDLSEIFDLRLLNEILSQNSLGQIP